MNNVEQLAAMLNPGGKARISEMCEVHPAIITRWVKRNGVPARYNFRLKRGLADYAALHGHGDAWLIRAMSYLVPDECSHCGQVIKQK